MTDKHAALAVFIASDSDATWETMMEHWNRENPGDEYSDRRVFFRDATVAWERIVGSRWVSKSSRKDNMPQRAQDPKNAKTPRRNARRHPSHIRLTE